jgi:hypothetical protein
MNDWQPLLIAVYFLERNYSYMMLIYFLERANVQFFLLEISATAILYRQVFNTIYAASINTCFCLKYCKTNFINLHL